MHVEDLGFDVGATGDHFCNWADPRASGPSADIWNSLHFDPDFEVQLTEIAPRVAKMDELCRDAGRDPETLRRSFTVFDAHARAGDGAIRYYDDPDLFVDLVQRLTALDMSEISIYYPSQAEQIPKFEHVAGEVIPQLRTEHAAR